MLAGFTRCGARLIGYCGRMKAARRPPVASTKSRASPATKPIAQAERFIRRKDRLFLKRLCGAGAR